MHLPRWKEAGELGGLVADCGRGDGRSLRSVSQDERGMQDFRGTEIKSGMFAQCMC